MIPQDSPSCYHSPVRNLVVLFIHFIATLARLLAPGGVRSLVGESLLLKHQLLILNRSRQRSPRLSAWDRILAGLLALLVLPSRLFRSAIVVKPSTLLGLHRALSKRKYRLLFSQNRRRKPGPKGPSTELIRAVVEMKQRNPNWGCPRIAQQIAVEFSVLVRPGARVPADGSVVEGAANVDTSMITGESKAVPKGHSYCGNSSRATYRKVIQNLVWATAYNLVAIPVAGGLFVHWGFDLPMSVGAVAMSLSTIIAAANAQLLRRLKLWRG